MINNSWIALVITFIIVIIWLRLNDFAAHKGWIGSHLSRKIIHMGTGPIFVLCWLLFPHEPLARYLAATVPLLITIQFFLIGIGVVKDQSSVDAMSRSGDRREILRGPLFYGIVFVVLTIIYWMDNPIGIFALMLLCGGDALAEIVGSRIKSVKLPWAKRKSLVGSAAMFVGGWIFAFFITVIYVAVGQFTGTLSSYLLPITVISLAGMVIESLPFKDIDNLSVPAVAVALGYLFFH